MTSCCICQEDAGTQPSAVQGDPRYPVCNNCHFAMYQYKQSGGSEKWAAYFEARVPLMTDDAITVIGRILGTNRLQEIREEELKKREFASSFAEYFEYDIATVLNVNHGRINREEMLSVIEEHAKNGWRLHKVYSNELGKNALSVLGLGINSTACEDVLIFERRIPKPMQ